MSWNFRVVRKEFGPEHEEFGIYSVYYDEDGEVEYISVDPAQINSYSVEGLADLLELMKESLQKPILEYELQEHESVARAQAATNADDIRELYATVQEGQGLDSTDQIKALTTLIRNPSTPVDVLTSITQLRNFQGAPQLRHEAKNALNQRSQKESE